jgi:hypothetical protein
MLDLLEESRVPALQLFGPNYRADPIIRLGHRAQNPQLATDHDGRVRLEIGLATEALISAIGVAIAARMALCDSRRLWLLNGGTASLHDQPLTAGPVMIPVEDAWPSSVLLAPGGACIQFPAQNDSGCSTMSSKSFCSSMISVRMPP